MLFTSFDFLCLFLPAVFFVYEALRDQTRRLVWIILSSLFFYSYWDPRSLLLILTSISINLLFIHFLLNYKQMKVAVLGVMFNLIPLLYFKYSAFILENFGIILTEQQKSTFGINSLPLAISFYTFVAIAYLVDAYKGKIERHSPLRYTFFVTFFPHLLAGPIVHHSDLIPQIDQKVDRQRLFFEGVLYFLVGFAKKKLLADHLGTIVDPLFNLSSHQVLTFTQSVTASVGYTLQLYFDFSGYSDMAVGLGLLFGYRLPINFYSPYKSISITEFWRRWHITLSNFLKDYIYIPLGGNRRGKPRQYCNLLLTMLIGGLWHGAGWNFVLWGGLHGLFLAYERLTGDVIRFRLPPFLQRIRTFLLLCLLWILFRTDSMLSALNTYAGLLHPEAPFTCSAYEAFFLLSSLAIILLPNSHELIKSIMATEWAGRQRLFTATRQAWPGLAIGLAMCLVTMFLFYAKGIDLAAYRNFAIERYRPGISNQVGDYRANLLSSPLFVGDVNRMAVVGSSFVANLGFFAFEAGGQQYHSATLGIGSNPLLAGLRTSMAILDIDQLKVIVLGISPLNCGPIVSSDPFMGQLYAGVNDLGFHLAPHKFSEIRPINASIGQLFCLLSSEQLSYQFKNFIFNLGTAFQLATHENPDWSKSINFESIDDNFFDIYPEQLKTWIQKQSSNTLPFDTKNGNNDTFKWNNRNIFESLQTNGDVYKALVNLNNKCKERGIRFVIYNTPTPDHASAPNVYPPGFLKLFREEMNKITTYNDIEYYDFTDIFPWDGSFMMDFVHPTFEARLMLHKLLIYSIFKRGSPT